MKQEKLFTFTNKDHKILEIYSIFLQKKTPQIEPFKRYFTLLDKIQIKKEK